MEIKQNRVKWSPEIKNGATAPYFIEEISLGWNTLFDLKVLIRRHLLEKANIIQITIPVANNGQQLLDYII